MDNRPSLRDRYYVPSDDYHSSTHDHYIPTNPNAPANNSHLSTNSCNLTTGTCHLVKKSEQPSTNSCNLTTGSCHLVKKSDHLTSNCQPKKSDHLSTNSCSLTTGTCHLVKKSEQPSTNSCDLTTGSCNLVKKRDHLTSNGQLTKKSGCDTGIINGRQAKRLVRRDRPKKKHQVDRVCKEPLDKSLLDFKDTAPTFDIFLDARYWNLVFCQYPSFVSINYDLNINDEKPEYFVEQIRFFDDNSCPEIIAVFVNFKQGDVIVSRHNIVLVYDRLKNLVIQYNPHVPEEYVRLFDRAAMMMFPSDVTYRTLYNTETTHCVASCIYFAMAYIFNKDLYIDRIDTRRFAAKIKHHYGKIEGEPIVVMGHGDFSGQGALIGGLGGGLVGGLIAGPMGLVVGGVGGALIGGML